jgi:hypothetical protein
MRRTCGRKADSLAGTVKTIQSEVSILVRPEIADQGRELPMAFMLKIRWDIKKD